LWLVRTPKDGGKHEVTTTFGHDNSIMQGDLPILLNNVCEHTYYLHYESRRPKYLKDWWSVVDWDKATHGFELSDENSIAEL
jgi:Fe-Mn family superoxide dismutase